MSEDQQTLDAGVTVADANDLSWMPAWHIRELVAAREVSPVEVTDHFLARIEELEPAYHAFRKLEPEDARRQAKAAEKAVLAGEPLGLLHGVPVALKEHMSIEGHHWHDLKVNQASTAARDGIEAERLRAAGAILFGTTVAGLTATEFGDSDLQPLNPWDKNRVCGDSSSGSACAASTALTPITIAIDGLGSTRLPAAYSGLVGLVPTKGRVPSASWTDVTSRLLSRPGPLARDVRDNATVLSVLAGPDAREFSALANSPPDYLGELDQGAEGMRLVWSDDLGFGANFAVAETPDVIATVKQAAQHLVAAGATLEPMAGAVPDPTDACNTVLVADPGVFIFADPPEEKIVKAREMRALVTRSLESILEGKDFIICPTALQIAPTHKLWADSWEATTAEKNYMSTYASMTGFVNLIGWTAISLPAGLVQGSPVGLQIIGRPDSEPRMLRLAEAFYRRYQLGRPAIRL
ncbi:MAG: amidase [Novosphingobium sp.]|nr:amidase [Novosphingobium sp.]